MDKIGWGVLGPGRIARRFLNDLPRCEGARLVAVASRSAKKAKEFAQEYQFEKSYGSYEELACDPEVDIVYVATPHPFHLEHALLCMNAGKAVLCEKPVTVNAAEAREVTDCARRNNVFFMEAMWTRHFPVNRRVRDLIAGGLLGQVTLLQADFGFGAWNGGRVSDPEGRLFSPALAGGSLLDVGVYCVSYAAYMTGQKPSSVAASATMLETGVDGMTACLLHYDSGAMAMLESSVVQTTRQTAVIYCEHATIEVPDFWHPSRATIRYREAGRPDEVIDLPYGGDGATGFGFEAEEAMTCLRAGLKQSPRMPWSESVEIMETLDEIRECIGLRYPFEKE